MSLTSSGQEADAINTVTEVYNAFGQVVSDTTVSKPMTVGSGSNEVERVFSGTATTTTVSYGYGPAIDGSRLVSMQYPDGRQVYYRYNTGLDSSIGRISAVSDNENGTSILESYTYLGLDTVVELTRSGEKLTYIHQSGDSSAINDSGTNYTGFDRFGRVIDQYWLKTTDGSMLYRAQYGYDGDGNLLFTRNKAGGASGAVNSNFSEVYGLNGSTAASAYDQLNRSTGFARGRLTMAFTPEGQWYRLIVSTSSAGYGTYINQTWDYDEFGNKTSTDRIIRQARFDAWGHLVRYETSTQFSGTIKFATIYYNYDALGRCIATDSFVYTLNSAMDEYTSTCTYDLDGHRIDVVEDNNRIGMGRVPRSVHSQYIWSPVTGSLILRDRDSDGSTSTGGYGNSQGGFDERLIAIIDGRNNVVALSLPNGTVDARYTYLPGGVVEALNSDYTLFISGAFSDPACVYGKYAWQVLYQCSWGDIMRVESVYFMDGKPYSPKTGRLITFDYKGYSDAKRAYDYQQDYDKASWQTGAAIPMAVVNFVGISRVYGAVTNQDFVTNEDLNWRMDRRIFEVTMFAATWVPMVGLAAKGITIGGRVAAMSAEASALARAGIVAGEPALLFESGVISQYTGAGVSAAIRASITSGVISATSRVAGRMMTPRGIPTAAGADLRYVNLGPESGIIGGARDINCVKTAIATDATLAGHSATALPGLASETLGGSMKIISEYAGSNMTKISYDALVQAVQKAGVGARGIVIGYRNGAQFSHAFNVINKAGVVRFVDGQISAAARGVSEYDHLWYVLTEAAK